MKQFELKTDADGQKFLETELSGLIITRLPLLNKSTAFSKEERAEFDLEGLYPPHVSSLAEQRNRAYYNYKRFKDDLNKHIYLRVLQDRNEVLFYSLLAEHLDEFMPIIYTPTVAKAVELFSQIYRFPRGLVVSTENIDRIDELLDNLTLPDVQLIVATDSEGILGIGDQGFGGMAICIGKLSIYTAAAGINPAYTLPVELDVGTNRKDLLDDPLYLGVRHKRLEGKEYDDFIDKFVTGIKKKFPKVLLQWEDFSKQKAFSVLNKYQKSLASFNDDIQGTGSVVLAGLLAAMRKNQQELKDQKFLVHGAGAGGVGVAKQIVRGLMAEGLSEKEAKARIYLIDSRGLILDNRDGLEPYKLELAKSPSDISSWNYKGKNPDLLDTIKNANITAILGLSGQRSAFNKRIVKAVSRNTDYPIVFALSNPTSNSEAIPMDIYKWTDGKAIVATGSPFDDVEYQGSKYAIGQGNNAYVFPGIGLGAILSGADRITDSMLTAAAQALAHYTSPKDLSSGRVYPTISKLRSVSKHVAVAVIKAAIDSGVASKDIPDDIAGYVEENMWKPEYLPLRKK